MEKFRNNYYKIFKNYYNNVDLQKIENELHKFAFINNYSDLDTLNWLYAIYLAKDCIANKILKEFNNNEEIKVIFSNEQKLLLSKFKKKLKLLKNNNNVIKMLNDAKDEYGCILKYSTLKTVELNSDIILIALAKNDMYSSALELNKYNLTYLKIKEIVYEKRGISKNNVYPICNGIEIKHLYKYISFDENDKQKNETIFKSIFLNNRIKYTPPVELNDKFELLSKIQSICDENDIFDILSTNDKFFKERRFGNILKKKKGIISFAINTYLKHILENTLQAILKKQICILSLSSRHDIMPMWVHYSSNYKGYVIEFDIKNSYFLPNKQENCVKPIQYNNEIYPVDKFYLRANQGYNILHYFACQKNKDWSYEYEWRKIKDRLHLKEINTAVQNSVFLDDFPVESITKIIFGCDADEDFKAFVKEVISNNLQCNHIELYNSIFDDETQTLRLIKY